LRSYSPFVVAKNSATNKYQGEIKMFKKTVLLSLFFTANCFAEVKVLPLFNGFFGYGNAFYKEQSGTPSINYNIDYVPALIFSDKLTLLPRLSSTYNGTMIPLEIEEEGNIYTQLWDNLIFTKAIHRINSDWTLRGELGVKKEMARETADETWGTGLYDYSTSHLEASLERRFAAAGQPITLTFGDRVFATTFPNYQSLAAGTTQYLQLAGKNVLDTGSNEIFIKAEWLLNQTFLRCQFGATQSNYSDQKIISAIDGHYLPDLRKDAYTNLSIGASQLLPSYNLPSNETGDKKFKAFLGINYESITKTSNQCLFDADKIFGEENYYSYRQNTISPSITLRFLPSNSDLSLSYDIVQKKYTNRLVQDVNGNYDTSGELIYQNSTVLNFKYAFPVAKSILASVSGGFRAAKSNMLYEKYFQYNFTAYNYMIGIAYEY